MNLSLEKIKSVLSNVLVEKLKQNFGQNSADKILKGFAEQRLVSVRINTLKANPQQIMEEFRQSGINFQRINFLPNALIVANKAESFLEKLDIYKDGKIYLQNLASQLPVIFLDLKPGETVLDMCSAPGSKTTQIAAMMANSGKIVANELDQIRFEKLKYNLKMQGVNIAEPICGNAVYLGEKYPETFDKILLDVPCSAEGKMGVKEPRTHKFWSEKVVRENAKLQKRLILSGFQALKPGGVMVYSTCSLMKEENDDIVEFLLQENRGKAKADLLNFDLENGLKGRYGITVLPNKTWEGFYFAKISKL